MELFFALIVGGLALYFLGGELWKFIKAIRDIINTLRKHDQRH